jgi:hypothetical protein
MRERGRRLAVEVRGDLRDGCAGDLRVAVSQPAERLGDRTDHCCIALVVQCSLECRSRRPRITVHDRLPERVCSLRSDRC